MEVSLGLCASVRGVGVSIIGEIRCSVAVRC